MVKIRISYQDAQELERVLKILKPQIKSYKVAKQQDGAYKRAYVILKE